MRDASLATTMVGSPAHPRPARPLVFSTLALAIALVATPTRVDAGVIEGVHFADSVRAETGILVLNGMVLYEATFLKVDIFVGGLYLPKKTREAKVVLEPGRAKRMVQIYRRDIGAKDMRKGFKKALRKLAGSALDQHNANIETFVRYFGGVKEGDKITYDFSPGRGLVVHQQGRKLGSIQDPNFASLVFSLWVGPTADPSVRDPLLGRGS